MKSVRIAGGPGFYGDSWRPIRASIERGNVQYVASDHLAELTLAILQKDRQRDPALSSTRGYTRDLVPMLAELLPLAIPRGVKFILNAGGLNPMAAREVLLAAIKKFGLSHDKSGSYKVGIVLGDAVLERLDELQAAGVSLAHMDTGEDIATVRERMLFASAYLGAQPLVEALKAGADIVLTGRVADAALFLAPTVHEFGWRWDDWDKLAQGIVVGHLLECSGQATGGNFGGDWRSIPDLAHIGYPIAEVWENGDAVISKAPGTGGRVNFDTLREQLLYEVHDPAHYLTPDVDVDMTTLRMEEIGPDQVRVTGATGRPAPEMLKIIAGYEDGVMGQAMIGYA
ncbi:MAG TPA: acyclic terpene utilization AtuA family protein, partial [Ktedonobacteraceae bacterium]|nr:acyclic terpene utilization AtuA family protein [Ktedonobacteraceae bacterium]